MIAPQITRRLITEFAARRDPQAPPTAFAELTDRERQILQLVAAGLTNAEIAGRLVISPLTAKTHVQNVLRKLDCRGRAALAAFAYETGLITPGRADADARHYPRWETELPPVDAPKPSGAGRTLPPTGRTYRAGPEAPRRSRSLPRRRRRIWRGPPTARAYALPG